MAGEAERVQAYQDTVARLEPEITMIDTGAALASISISLKRIADSLDQISAVRMAIGEQLSEIVEQLSNLRAE